MLVFTFFLTLTVFSQTSLLAQFGPTRLTSGFTKKSEVRKLRFKTRMVPDSSIQKIYPGKCVLNASNGLIFIAITNSGALLAFEDSLARFPIGLEKRNVYPFEMLKDNSLYTLEYTSFSGMDGYLAFRLTESVSGRILDEVYLCLPKVPDGIGSCLFPTSAWIEVIK